MRVFFIVLIIVGVCMGFIPFNFLFTDSTVFTIISYIGWGISGIGFIGLSASFRTFISKKSRKRATATIQAVRQTNTYINNLPQLELSISFKTENGQSINTKAYATFDFVTIPSIVPGVQILIIYDENKPQKVKLDYSTESATN